MPRTILGLIALANIVLGSVTRLTRAKTIALPIRSVDRWVTLHLFCQGRRSEFKMVVDIGTDLGVPA